jgi:hypothetical protein
LSIKIENILAGGYKILAFSLTFYSKALDLISRLCFPAFLTRLGINCWHISNNILS